MRSLTAYRRPNLMTCVQPQIKSMLCPKTPRAKNPFGIGFLKTYNRYKLWIFHISNFPTRKHNPLFLVQKAVTISSTPALHKTAISVSSLCRHSLYQNQQKCIPPNIRRYLVGYLCFLIGTSLGKRCFSKTPFLFYLPQILWTITAKYSMIYMLNYALLIGGKYI